MSAGFEPTQGTMVYEALPQSAPKALAPAGFEPTQGTMVYEALPQSAPKALPQSAPEAAFARIAESIRQLESQGVATRELLTGKQRLRLVVDVLSGTFSGSVPEEEADDSNDGAAADVFLNRGDEYTQALRDVFLACDANGDGSINLRELIKACRQRPEVATFLGLPSEIHQEGAARRAVMEFFQGADSDNDREITWEEFCRFCCEHRPVAGRSQQPGAGGDAERSSSAGAQPSPPPQEPQPRSAPDVRPQSADELAPAGRWLAEELQQRLRRDALPARSVLDVRLQAADEGLAEERQRLRREALRRELRDRARARDEAAVVPPAAPHSRAPWAGSEVATLLKGRDKVKQHSGNEEDHAELAERHAQQIRALEAKRERLQRELWERVDGHRPAFPTEPVVAPPALPTEPVVAPPALPTEPVVAPPAPPTEPVGAPARPAKEVPMLRPTPDKPVHQWPRLAEGPAIGPASPAKMAPMRALHAWTAPAEGPRLMRNSYGALVAAPPGYVQPSPRALAPAGRAPSPSPRAPSPRAPSPSPRAPSPSPRALAPACGGAGAGLRGVVAARPAGWPAVEPVM